MRSPEAASPPDASATGPSRTAPRLRLVGAQDRSGLTPLEREFLPPLLEIQETPPSLGKRWLLWSIVSLVAALIAWATIGQISIVATAPGEVYP